MPVRRLLVVALLLGACAGSDDAAPTTVATSAVTTTLAPTTVESTVAATAAPTSPTTVPPTISPTTDPSTTVAATTAPTTAVVDLQFDDWCGLALAVEAATEGRDDVDFTDPVAVEAYVEPVAALMEQAVVLAPPEIAAAVALSAGNTLIIYDALSGNGFDMLTLDLSEIGVVEEGADEATDAIETYNETVCGIPPEVDEGDDDPIDLGTGSLRDLFVDQLVASGFTEVEAKCIFGELDFGAEITDAAVEAAFDACGIDPRRLEELAAVVGG